MNANDVFIYKIIGEYRAAKAAGRQLNWREVAGGALAAADMDPTQAIKDIAARIAMGKLAEDSIEVQAARLLERIAEHAARCAAPRPAGEVQTASPAPATAQAGSQV